MSACFLSVPSTSMLVPNLLCSSPLFVNAALRHDSTDRQRATPARSAEILSGMLEPIRPTVSSWDSWVIAVLGLFLPLGYFINLMTFQSCIMNHQTDANGMYGWMKHHQCVSKVSRGPLSAARSSMRVCAVRRNPSVKPQQHRIRCILGSLCNHCVQTCL